MEKTVTCLLHAQTDDHGNLYKTAKVKLEDLTEAIKPFVNASTRWLHDGARPAISTILCLAPRFDLHISRKDLEEDIAAAESGNREQGKAQAVAWLPSLEPHNTVQGPYRSELERTREEIFARLATEGSVLACMREQYFRSFFDFVGGTPYAGRLDGGDAIILEFVERERASAEALRESALGQRTDESRRGEKEPPRKKEFVLANSRRLTA